MMSELETQCLHVIMAGFAIRFLQSLSFLQLLQKAHNMYSSIRHPSASEYLPHCYSIGPLNEGRCQYVLAIFALVFKAN